MHGRKTTSQCWTDPGRKALRRGSALEAICLQIVDASLAGLIIVAPFFFGGRHDLGRLLFVCLCAVAAAAWFVAQAAQQQATWCRTPALALVAVAIAVVGFQLAPLPPEWIDRLAPRANDLLPLWSSDSASVIDLGNWKTLSLFPGATKAALAMLIAYALLLVTAVQRIRTIGDVTRILQWMAISAVAMASFGLVQYFFSNGEFFWFYVNPFTDTASEVKGAFTCRNHFAHFLVLGLTAVVASLVLRLPGRDFVKSKRPAPRHAPSKRTTSETMATALLLAGMATVIVAVLLSLSRGGAMALTAVALVLALTYVRLRLISAGECGVALGALLLIACALLSVYGYDRVALRLDDFTEGSVESLDQGNGRRTIWMANVEAIRAGWLGGAGAGTHRYIYPAYMETSIPREYTHAENGYLQVVTENGLPGVVLLGAGLLCCGGWCVRALTHSSDRGRKAVAGAITAALAASAVHSLVDFVWFVPACMTLTILFAACAIRLPQLAAAEEPQATTEHLLSRPAWVGIATVVLLAGIWAVGTFVGPAQASIAWDRYLLASRSHAAMSMKQLNSGTNLEVESNEDEQVLIASMIADLQQVVRCDKSNCRAHLRLASNYLWQFNHRQLHAPNQMSVSQIRGAAMASQFTSAQELRNWLDKAFGENCELLYRAYHHARRAIRLCPMEGEAYVVLAKLCFLEGKPTSAIDAYLDQAVRTSPHDSAILFAVGMERMNLGQVQLAFESWKSLFQYSCTQRYRVVNLLAQQLPAADILQLFQPDWRTVRFIWNRYQTPDQSQDKEAIVSYARQVAEQEAGNQTPQAASYIWLGLASMQATLEQNDAALESLAKGYQLDPSNFYLRGLLGQTLLRVGRAQEAETHLRWCLARQPGHAGYQRALLEATKVRVSQAPTEQARWQ